MNIKKEHTIFSILFFTLPIAFVALLFIIGYAIVPAKSVDFCNKCGGTYVLEYSYRSFNHNTYHYECTHCGYTIDINVKD